MYTLDDRSYVRINMQVLLCFRENMTHEKLLEAMISEKMSYLYKMERPMSLVFTQVHKFYVADHPR